ncbi:unannotated protein [freshwater metagenome]|uniref:Unannotated protein n=1 Tax=freshwater metagenome TaxID=449393 RepID=A0A6J7JAP2_9ZZZZ
MEVRALRPQLEAPALQAGEVEQVVGEAREPLDLHREPREEPVALLLVELLVLQQLDEAGERLQRGAQLVRGGGDEPLAARVQFAELALHRVERPRQRAELVGRVDVEPGGEPPAGDLPRALLQAPQARGDADRERGAGEQRDDDADEAAEHDAPADEGDGGADVGEILGDDEGAPPARRGGHRLGDARDEAVAVVDRAHRPPGPDRADREPGAGTVDRGAARRRPPDGGELPRDGREEHDPGARPGRDRVDEQPVRPCRPGRGAAGLPPRVADRRLGVLREGLDPLLGQRRLQARQHLQGDRADGDDRDRHEREGQPQAQGASQPRPDPEEPARRWTGVPDPRRGGRTGGRPCGVGGPAPRRPPLAALVASRHRALSRRRRGSGSPGRAR